MYLGSLCEVAAPGDLFSFPLHPYTRALLSAVPKIGKAGRAHIKLKGEVLTPINLPGGCVFHGRCLYADERCTREVPDLITIDCGTRVACHGIEEGRL